MNAVLVVRPLRPVRLLERPLASSVPSWGCPERRWPNSTPQSPSGRTRPNHLGRWPCRLRPYQRPIEPWPGLRPLGRPAGQLGPERLLAPVGEEGITEIEAGLVEESVKGRFVKITYIFVAMI